MKNMLAMRRFTYIGKIREPYYCCFNPKRKEERRLKINGWKHRFVIPDDDGGEDTYSHDECRAERRNTNGVWLCKRVL